MLLGKIIIKQKELALPDGQFATRLHRSRVTWNQVKNGNWPLSKGLAIEAMRAFPDLTVDVLRFLQGDGNE